MAFYDLVWYCNAGDQSTTGYYAVAKWAATTAIAAGVLRRQLAAPTVGNERVFACVVAGTTGGSEPAWPVTRGGAVTDGTVHWVECTGQAAVNGDLTNTPNWAAFRGNASAPSIGAIIQRNNGVSYQICTTSGSTMGVSEPAFSDTAGVTTAETAGTGVWTSLGPVGNFGHGAAPHARLVNVFGSSWFTQGNTAFVGDNHAESQASAISIAPPAANPYFTNKIICHNHSGSYPPAGSDVTTGGTITTTSGAISITVSGNSELYMFGLTFASVAGLNSTATSAYLYADGCTFKAAGAFNVLALSGALLWNNCLVSFGSTTQFIDVGNSEFVWQNTSVPVLATGSVVPSSLFGENAAGRSGRITLEALDLSQITSLFSGNLSPSVGSWTVKDCKLNASVVIGSLLNSGQVFQLVRSDSSATAYKSSRYNYEGIETTETSITRVSGASDPAGQAQSRKIVTTGNISGAFPVSWVRPFKAEPYAIWNSTIGANVTVTVYGTINAGALPNNDDIWLEVEYLGSASSPIGTIVTTTKASLFAANAAIASDGSTWNGGGSGAGWSPFKLVATLSSPQPGMAGYLHARVRAAKAGTTWYIDPKIVLS